MNHIFGVFTQFISMIATYVTVFLIVAFDSLIFGYPIMWIYNSILATKFTLPEFTYFEMVLTIFLFKLIAVLWKSVHMDAPEPEYITQEKKEQING